MDRESYLKCSLEELYDVHRHIDKEKYPERVQVLLEVISEKEEQGETHLEKKKDELFIFAQNSQNSSQGFSKDNDPAHDIKKESNIYAPPQSILEQTTKGQEGIYKIATTSQRFINYIIDHFLISFFAFLLGAILAWIERDVAMLKLYGSTLGIVMTITYYFICENAFLKTLGKIITKTRVISIDGSDPTAKQIIIRTLCRLIPFEAFSFFGGNGHPVGWHDRLSRTRLISIEPEFSELIKKDEALNKHCNLFG